MFLMIGITQGRKDFEYSRMVICRHCGAYGRYEVFMTYSQLLLFLIPCFKWNKKYYVQMSCCGTIYELNSEVGKRIATGADIEIMPGDLREVYTGRGRYRRCSNCGYSTREDYEYCPKCGCRF